MVTYTTAIRIVDGVRQQVIQIDQHTSPKYEENQKPPLFKESKRYDYGNDKMNPVMRKKPKHWIKGRFDFQGRSVHWYLH